MPSLKDVKQMCMTLQMDIFYSFCKVYILKRRPCCRGAGTETQPGALYCTALPLSFIIFPVISICPANKAI